MALHAASGCWAGRGLGLVVQMVFRLRGLLGFFGTSRKLSPVNGGGQRYVAVCVREGELGQMIALNRVWGANLDGA